MVERQQRCIGIVVISIMLATLIIVLGVQLHNLYVHRSLNKRIEEFERKRESVFLRERYQHLGGKYDLSTKEMLVNNRIVTEKHIDKNDFDDRGIIRSRRENSPSKFFSEFANGKGFFEKLRERPLFKLLQSMPKGAALHVNDFAMCSGDCLLGFTYKESLWICINDMQVVKNGSKESHEHENEHENGHEYEYEIFRFSKEEPTEFDDLRSDCKWVLLSDLRLKENNSVVDQKLREHFKFRNSKLHFSLQHFRRLIHGLLTFEPIWYSYIQKSLEQFKADNVQYVEIFSALPTLYNLQRSNFTYMDTARLMRDAVRIVSARNPEFVGAMLIYEPLNDATDRDYNKFLERALRLKHAFTDFFAGINLASNIQYISRLYLLSRKLIALEDEIDFFYHVDGIHGNQVASNDENLIDSVLLGSKRITYHSAYLRHPQLMHLVRGMNVAIEITPTTIVKGTEHSVSKLCDHPSTLLFAAGYPLVITSEYSNFWNSTPLTHDFYLAFVGITSKSASLGTLKELAVNSLKLSSSRFTQKRKLYNLWSKMWDDWIEQITEYEL